MKLISRWNLGVGIISLMGAFFALMMLSNYTPTFGIFLFNLFFFVAETILGSILISIAFEEEKKC